MERNASLHNTLSKIDFCLLGMPTRIQFTNGSVTEYIYAADGTKLRTIHRTSVNGPAIPYGTRHTLTNQETLSLDSITYIDGLEIDKFFNCKYYFDNGYLTLGNTGFGEYHYTIKDHLGNIRTVVDASGSVEQVNNYYAYGGMLNDVPASVDVQTHKYNGKELDLMHGLNEYDYGARQYDPAIAQFTTVDPLCEKYYHISPYVYCGGNPVNRVDPDGKAYGSYFTKYGNYIGSDGIDDKKIYIIGKNEDVKLAKKEVKTRGEISKTFSTKAVYIGNQTTIKESYEILNSNSNVELSNITYTDNSKETRTAGTQKNVNFPKIDASKTVDASIHLHPLTINKNSYSITKPSDTDVKSFENFNVNIIVGNISTREVPIDQNIIMTGNYTPTYEYTQGISIYNSSSKLMEELNKSALTKIVKHIK